MMMMPLVLVGKRCPGAGVVAAAAVGSAGDFCCTAEAFLHYNLDCAAERAEAGSWKSSLEGLDCLFTFGRISRCKS